MAKYLNLDGLQTLWTKIKSLFLSKSDFDASPAGKILEIPYGSTNYTLAQLISYANNGYSIFCVASGIPKMTLVHIGVGPGDIDIATFVGPYVPNTNFAYTATMNANKEWYNGTANHTVYWGNIGNKPESFPPSTHSHAASDITSGTLPDARIASASKWNAKQDALPTSYPSGGMTKYYISARVAIELLQSDRGNLFFEYLGTTEVLKITMPSGKTTGLSSILVQTVAADGWPLIFMVGWNWGGSAFTKGPKLSYLYTTSQSTSSKDKQATIKYSVDSIFIKVNQTQTSRKMMVSIIGGNIGDLTISNSDENAEYNVATLVSGDNVEGCVMKMDVGSAVGSNSNPVFVEASGFLKACTSVNASTWNGMSGDFTGSIPSSPSENTIYWV